METSDRAPRKDEETGAEPQSTSPADPAAPGARPKSRRGFASMSPEQRAHIAAMGGAAAHRAGTAHKWTREEAQAAGRIGGKVSRGGRGKGQFVGSTKTARVLHAGHRWTSEQAAEAGRKGGQESRGGKGKILDFETDGFPEQTNFGDSTRF